MTTSKILIFNNNVSGQSLLRKYFIAVAYMYTYSHVYAHTYYYRDFRRGIKEVTIWQVYESPDDIKWIIYLDGIKFKYFILKLISWVRAQFIYRYLVDSPTESRQYKRSCDKVWVRVLGGTCYRDRESLPRTQIATQSKIKLSIRRKK